MEKSYLYFLLNEMSEFSKLNKEFSNLNSQIDVYKQSLHEVTTSAEVSKIEKALELIASNILQSCIPMIDKFQSKIDSVDPVSGISRYGDNMKSKIRQLNTDIMTMDDSLKTLIQLANERYRILKAQEPEPEPEAELQLQDIIENQGIINNRSNGMESTDKEIYEQQELQRQMELEKLHNEAEKARLKKRKRLECKQYFVTELQNRVVGLKTQKLPLMEALGSMLTPINERKDIVMACSTIVDILDKVTLKPDDRLLRTIKLNHPVFYNRVSRVCGSDKLLLAIGFEFKIEMVVKHSNNDVLLLLNESYQDVLPNFEHLLQTVTELSLSTSTVALAATAVEVEKNQLKPVEYEKIDEFIETIINPKNGDSTISAILQMVNALGYDMLAIMIEPVVDTSALDGFQLWIEWFDSIKIHSDKIKEFLKTLS